MSGPWTFPRPHEAIPILVDYIFLHKDVVRVQAEIHPDIVASQRVLPVGYVKN